MNFDFNQIEALIAPLKCELRKEYCNTYRFYTNTGKQLHILWDSHFNRFKSELESEVWTELEPSELFNAIKSIISNKYYWWEKCSNESNSKV